MILVLHVFHFSFKGTQYELVFYTLIGLDDSIENTICPLKGPLIGDYIPWRSKQEDILVIWRWFAFAKREYWCPLSISEATKAEWIFDCKCKDCCVVGAVGLKFLFLSRWQCSTVVSQFWKGGCWKEMDAPFLKNVQCIYALPFGGWQGF